MLVVAAIGAVPRSPGPSSRRARCTGVRGDHRRRRSAQAPGADERHPQASADPWSSAHPRPRHVDGVLYLSILVLALYFVFSGHNDPGGGFVGGLVAGAGWPCATSRVGLDDVRSMVRAAAARDPRHRRCPRRVTAPCPCSSATRAHQRRRGTSTCPCSARSRSRLGAVVRHRRLPGRVGLVLMVFEAFGEDLPTPRPDRRRRRRSTTGRAPTRGAAMSVLLAVAAGVLFAIGTYLVLQRKLQPDHHRARPARPRRQRPVDHLRPGRGVAPLHRLGDRRATSPTRCPRRSR